MKALSIKQPWAWLIANGYKTVENRKWYTAHRGDLLIHAGKSDAEVDRDIELVRRTYKIGIDREQLVFGKVIAVAEVIACTKEPEAWIDKHWHVKGCFAWSLRRIRTEVLLFSEVILKLAIWLNHSLQIDGGLSAAMIIALHYTQKNFGKLPTSSTS